VLVDQRLGSPPYPPFSEREKLQTFGYTAAGVGAVGLAAGVVGAALWVICPRQTKTD
jgi:hypothetical protein